MKATPETANGLRVDITILCETEGEILTHLRKIQSEIKARLKEEPEVKYCWLFEDQNCYGEHFVVINLDK